MAYAPRTARVWCADRELGLIGDETERKGRSSDHWIGSESSFSKAREVLTVRCDRAVRNSSLKRGPSRAWR